MQSFPTLDCKLKFNKLSKDDLHKKDNLFNLIPFHCIHLLLPSSENFIEDYKEILTSQENNYFIVYKIAASALVESTFLENFVKRGLLCAISKNCESHYENSVNITLSGKLILKLENNIAGYLSLLKEKLSHKSQKATQTHQVCVIDVNSKDFVSGKKFHKLVLSELKKIDHIKFDLLLKWKPEGNICCESIREYFESQGLECTPCEPSLKQETTPFYIPVPIVDFDCTNLPFIENIMEWIGAQICDIKYSDETKKFVSKFYVPEPSESRKLHIGACQGFYTSDEILTFLERVGDFFEKDTKMPFIALSFSGYQYCCVDSKDFGKVSSADKLIYILISPKSDYWVITLNL